jgi:hypothetical protein
MGESVSNAFTPISCELALEMESIYLHLFSGMASLHDCPHTSAVFIIASFGGVLLHFGGMSRWLPTLCLSLDITINCKNDVSGLFVAVVSVVLGLTL